MSLVGSSALLRQGKATAACAHAKSSQRVVLKHWASGSEGCVSTAGLVQLLLLCGKERKGLF